MAPKVEKIIQKVRKARKYLYFNHPNYPWDPISQVQMDTFGFTF